ncbi:MAG: transporter substrate-binding domain-containing protein [Colwellia sp.]|nr:transporter substrate-binding domain-containing protein [Colwellia sp.]
MQKILFKLLRSLVALPIIFSFCTATTVLAKTPLLTEVKLQLFWKHQFEFAGFYAAIEKGYFHKKGIKVKFVEYGPQVNHVNSVLENNAQFGIAGTGLIKSYHDGKDVKLLASYFKRSPLTLVTQPEITSLKQLQGETIHGLDKLLERGSIREMLNLHNVDFKQIKTTQANDSIDLFKNKKVAAILAFITDMPYELTQSNIPYRVYDPSQFGMITQDLNLFTTGKFARENPLLVKNFVQAVNKGWQYAIKHPTEIINLIKRKYNQQNKSTAALKYEAIETQKLMLSELYPIGSIQKNKLKIISEKLLINKTIKQLRPINDFLIKPDNLNSIDSELLALLTKKEIRYLTNHSVISVQNESDYPPFNFMIKGEAVGFSIDYIKMLAKKMGIKIRFIQNKSWFDYMGMFKEKKIDAMLNITATENRQQYANFSTPYAQPNNIAITRKGELVSSLSRDSFKNRKLVVIKGYASVAKYIEKYPLLTIITVKNTKQALMAIKSKDADIFLSNDIVASYYIEKFYYTGLELTTFSAELNYSNRPLSIATLKNNIHLTSIFQKAIDTIPEYQMIALRKKWLNQIKNKDNAALNLTPEEQQYITEHPIITVQSDIDFPPLNYIKNGRPTGHSIDFINEISNISGLEIKFTKNRIWGENLKALNNKKLDAMVNIMDIESRQFYAAFTSPYMELTNLAVTRKSDQLDVVTTESISGKRIVITEGFAINQELIDNFPNSTFITVKGTFEALEAVSTNQGDIYFEAGIILQYYIENKFLANLQLIPIAKEVNLENYKYSLATHKDNPVLLSILQKSINVIPENKQIELRRKWFGYTENTNKNKLILTPVEQEYIRNSTVTLCRPRIKERSSSDIRLIDLLNKNIKLKIRVTQPTDWDSALQAINDKTCDFLTNITPSKKREKTLTFTPPYFIENMVIITKNEKAKVRDLSEHLKESFVVRKSTIIVERLKQSYPEISLIEVSNIDDAFDLIENKKVFGLIYTKSHAQKLLNIYSESSLKVNNQLREVFDELQTIATHKDNKLLHGILSKAVNAADKDELRKLIISAAQPEQQKIIFSPTETSLIKSREVIWCRSDIAEAWWFELMPYLIQSTEIQLIRSKETSWQEAFVGLKNGTCDILPGITATDARKKEMLFTPTFYQEERVIVTTENQMFITNIENHLDKELVILRGDLLVEQLKAEYPNIKLKLVNHQLDGLQLVQENKAFAYIGSITNTINIINRFALNNLKISGRLTDKFNDVWAFATRKNDKHLHAIFSKIIQVADKKKVREIITNQFAVKYEKGFDYQLFWKLLLIASIILIAIMYWNRRLTALNNQLKEANDFAEEAQKTILTQEKMSSLGTLTAGVAHEINNPVNFTHAAVYMMREEIDEIKSFLKQLAGGDDADEEVLQSFENKFTKLIELTHTATEGTKRIKTIVSDLRLFSRFDKTEQENIELSTIINSTIHLVKTQYDGINIETSFSDVPTINCFPSKLSQVFMNIIVNGCQAIESQKSIDPQHSGKITAAMKIKEQQIQISFTDNGGGMDEKTLLKVFDPFFTTKDVGSGTGLGMAISFGIVEEHGGIIEIESTLHAGSTITIYLPI